jgi:hypothetical protein
VSHFLKTCATTVLATATLWIAALAEAGAAGADGVDDSYLASLSAAGIPEIAPGRAISAARVVCRTLSEGVMPDELIAEFVAKKVFATDLQNAAMIIASMSAYCPQYLSRLDSRS